MGEGFKIRGYNSNFMMAINTIVLVLAISASVLAASAPENLPKGEIVRKVACSAVPTYSYALYLPRAYDPAKKWPILYCFDPGARGSVPLEQFKAAAEEYGYIVVGSNDSHNGPNVPLESIIATVWQDTHSRFSIDEKRVYTSGFSGGARVAVAVGYWKQADVAGVIACSGGFPGNRKPDKDVPFALFGTTGVEDFNFPEMFNLAESLDSFGVTNRLEIFDGDHQWAPTAVCTEAIEWMEIEAIRAGRRSKDPDLIQKLAARTSAIAENQTSSGKTYQAWRSYSAMASGFAGLADIASYQAKAAELGNSKAVKEQLKQIKEEIKRQQTLTVRLEKLKRAATAGIGGSYAFDESSPAQQTPGTVASSSNDEPAQSRATAAADLKGNLKDLKKASMNKEQTPDKIVASRVLFGFFVGCYEAAEILKSNKNYELAAANLEFSAEVRPQSTGVFYSLAQAYALAGNRSKALTSLDKAVTNGWSDSGAIENEKAFDSIRKDPAFARLLDRLKESKPSAKP